jgi:hypothetical protein
MLRRVRPHVLMVANGAGARRAAAVDAGVASSNRAA